MLHSLVWLISIIVLGLILNAILFKVVSKSLVSLEERVGLALKKRFNRLFRWLIPLLLILLFIPSLPLPEVAEPILRRVLSLLFIALLAWLAMLVVLSFRDYLLARYDISAKDNLKARAVHTQVRVFVRILGIVIGIVATASALMIFDNVRQVGTSILASAGVIGIIVGFAAQRSIATLLAGLQLAITQPIRIDDVVIVDGEWGVVEEISLTYVVVRIWDLRRLIVPTSRFLEQPFQNWTRTSADLLGTVILHVDYRVPVAAVRSRLHAILKDNPLWDGLVWRLHVVNAGERTVELRALMSVANSANGWELRCQVREQLIDFLQQHYPGCLPRLRAEVLEPARY